MHATQVIACIGAGRMGMGIAHCAAFGGHAVHLLDAKPRDPASFATFRADALKEIEGRLSMLAGLGAFEAKLIPTIMARVTVFPLGEAAAALASLDIIFERVPDSREAKGDGFALFDAHAPQGAILASTTSTMLSTELAGLTARPANFLNTHFLNTAFLVPLVEVSPSDQVVSKSFRLWLRCWARRARSRTLPEANTGIENLISFKGAQFPKSVILYAIYFPSAFQFLIATSKRSWPTAASIWIMQRSIGGSRNTRGRLPKKLIAGKHHRSILANG